MKPDKASILIKRGALECEKTAAPILAEYDITFSQFKVLKFLYHNTECSARLMDLEKCFSLTHPSAIGIVKNLEKKKLVTRVSDEEHPRIRYIILTEKGEALRENLISAGDLIEDKLTSGLTAEERKQLIHLLSKMQKIDIQEDLT